MAIGDIIVGIDIGASKISLVVGEVNNFNQIEVICNASRKSNGIKKDKIVDENALAEDKLSIYIYTWKVRYNYTKQCYKGS